MTGYALIVVGTSWGGLNALSTLLDGIEDEIELPIVIAQHRGTDSAPDALERLLQEHVARPVVQASDKEPLRPSRVYVAPPDYHLLVDGHGLALSTDARVQYARPSIDVLFESAADAYRERTIGIVLTGANADGAAGLKRIKEAGGVAIVQDPRTAEAATMPTAALAASAADAVLPLEEIPHFLRGLVR